MKLSSGTILGAYEVLSPIGAGGMGEVYRARDTKLDREVAIKILPAEFARDKERVLRFEREAKLLASLNHPNIAAIYGFEESDGERFLVLELVEGSTLSQRLHDGPFSIDDALETCKQIAEALEAAHEKGVVHRDLKPANVMLAPDGTVKVLDFGLARAMHDEPSTSVATANSPTITADYTKPGVVLGSARYMSPEQARGRRIDKRTDIWSFGVVLYECMTGMSLFAGETAVESMGAVLHKDPDWSFLPPGTPPTIQLLLRRCLTKDRNRRLHDIADARVEIEQAIEDPSGTSLGLARAALDIRGRQPRTIVRTAMVALLLAAVAGVTWFAKPSPEKRVMRFTIPISEDRSLTAFRWPTMDISSDGTLMVFVGKSENNRMLYLRHMHQLDSIPLANTDGAHTPLFSPDGRWIAFHQDDKLKKISVLGGPATTICPAPRLRGASWGSDNFIVFAPDTESGLWRVSAAGGEPEQITDRGKNPGSSSHRWPHALPGGKAVIYTDTANQDIYDDANIVALSLETNERKVLIKGATYAQYVPTGHIVFERSRVLMGVPFDAANLEITGPEVPLLERVTAVGDMGSAQYCFSDTGLFLYFAAGMSSANTIPVWIDRSGNVEPASRHEGQFVDAVLSPDGKHIALSDGTMERADILVLELERDMLTRLTTHEAADGAPVWSPDGEWIFFASNRDGESFQIYRKRADGTGIAELLTSGDSDWFPTSISPNGKLLAMTEMPAGERGNIMILRLGDEPVAEPFLATSFYEGMSAISPNGKWIAYGQSETGTTEVYIQPFPSGGARVRVSAGRGVYPCWSRDGGEIIYREGRTLYTAAVAEENGRLRVRSPTVLLELPDESFSQQYDIAPDGGRLLFIRSGLEGANKAGHPTVIVNWFEELKETMSTLGG